MTEQETTTGEEQVENEAAAIITQVERFAPDAVRLAELVSIAARIEPELLRIMRLKLMPAAGAGVEADLWFSPLVQSRSSENVVLLAEVVDALRARLASPQHPIGLERAQQVLSEAHIHSSSAVRLEEQVTCLALSSDARKLEKIDQLLQSLMAAILEGEQRGMALARWASHALPRMPAEARDSSAAMAVCCA